MTLAECCFGSGGRGLDVSIPGAVIAAGDDLRLAASLFGETASCVIVSAAERDAADVLARAESAGVPAVAIGSVGGTRYRVSVDGELAVDLPIAEIEQIWETGLSHHFEPEAA